jgi:cytochrome P450 family 150 subfamily A5
MATTADFSSTDLFRDKELPRDPYPFYDWVREQGPIWYYPLWDVWLVTGYDEVTSIYRDPATWSNCNTVSGPFKQMSVPLEGDDITPIIEAHRDELPFSDQLPSFDPPKHTAHRGLLMGLITPKRLKENEEFMWRLADRQLDAVLPGGQCEFIDDFAQPYTLLVIADLLGVPESDHQALLRRAGVGRRLLGDTGEDEGRPDHPLDFLYGYFSERIEQLREEPRGDVLTGMARATFPDGSIPEPVDVARIAANLFSAGQETTVRLLSTALRLISDEPGLQQRLREHRELIPRFIEETLRLESPIKGAFRLALKTTAVGGVEIPAGSTVMLLHGATGRDPRQFECPDELRIDRPNVRHHISFGAGIHTCPGAPLARAEGRVVIERLFDRTSGVRVAEAAHGPAGARRYEYLPTYMIRGLRQLNLEFD